MDFQLATNLDSLQDLYKKLEGKSNFQAFQACIVYAYFKQKEGDALPPPRAKLRIGNKSRGGFSDKQFLSSSFNMTDCGIEGLKSIVIDGLEVECILFHYGQEL